MSWSFTPPLDTDLTRLRIAIGDVMSNDGPAPDHANLSDEMLNHFLDSAGSVAGAAAQAFEHLAALWISRPVFGPGELSTIHTNLYDKFMRLAAEWRLRDAVGDSDYDNPTVVRSVMFVRAESGTGGEYT